MKNYFLLVAMMLIAAFSVSAYDFEIDGIYYNYNEDGISVSVTMAPTYDEFGEVISDYSSYYGEIIIPETISYYIGPDDVIYTVTAIGDHAFYHSGVESVTIPETVTQIGESAFCYCSGLTRINVPKSVILIDRWAFDGCSSLTSMTVAGDNPNYDSRDNCNAIIETSSNTLIAGCKNTIIPNTVTAIGECAFENCNELTNIDIPNSVTTIGDNAFYSCTMLNSIDLPNSVTSIGEYAFAQCSELVSVTIPEYLTTINSNTFYYCTKLNNIRIPSTVTTIGREAFYKCYALSSIDIPNSVTTIGDNAFFNCRGLTTISIPNSVTHIGRSVFSQCTNLSSIDIPNSVISIGGDTFYNTPWYNNQPDGLVYAGMVVYHYKGTMPDGTNIVLQDGTHSITTYAFYNCRGLSSIVIPNSVQIVDGGAFYGCSNLKDVYVYNNDPSTIKVSTTTFYYYNGDFSNRTLHVPYGSLAAYQNNSFWSPYFGTIVEMEAGPVGDLSGDGTIDIDDVTMLIDVLLGNNTTTLNTAIADINGDNMLDIDDVTLLISQLLGR